MQTPQEVPAPGGAAREWSVLVASEDTARAERFVPPLLRAGFQVRRVGSAEAALRLVKERGFDLVVAVLPLPYATGLLAAMRKEGSPSATTGIVVVADETVDAQTRTVLADKANRLLPSESTPEELQATAEKILNAAPHVPIRAAARIQVVGQEGALRNVRVENISATGMLFLDADPPPPGAVLGFELAFASAPGSIRGRAQVARHVERSEPGMTGVGVRFVSFGGDGAKRLEAAIFQERAAAGAKEWRTGTTGRAAGVLEIPDEEELAFRRQELAELVPYLEGLLEKGLEPRVQAAEWYTAAAELGLESLATFAGILEAVHGSGTASRTEVSQQLTDLRAVQRDLAEFAEVQKDVASRVRILLQMRQPLERLLRALAITGAFGSGDSSGTGSKPGGRPKGLVADLVADVQRLLRTRRVLQKLPGQLAELRKPQYLLARRTRKRRIAEICAEYGTWAPEVGLDPERLRSRRALKQALQASIRELKRIDEQIALVHQRVYIGKLKQQATGSQDVDFGEGKLFGALVETLAAGSSFLVRAYSAYKHALELTGTDPRLLDRVAGLSAAITAAEKKLAEKRAARPERRGAPRISTA